MKLTFTESGGYAGLTRGVTLETNDLPAEEARQLEALVRSSGLLNSPAPGASAARDALQYELTIEDGRVVTTVVFDDVSKPPESVPLLRELRSRSRIQVP